MTLQEFYDQISELHLSFKNRDLEVYLRALLGLVDRHQNEAIDAEMLLKLLQTSFTSEPVEFNNEWLAITSSPDDNPEFEDYFDTSVVSDKRDVDFTTEVLKFQIAELNKMRGKQLHNDMRYFGIDSETGNRWYNFDPFTNLERGAACIIGHEDNPTQEFIVTWQTLGELLEMGQIYE